MPKITKRVLDALRPAVDGRDVFIWDAGDGSLKGFGVRMKPSGAASYLVQYRNREARTRRLRRAWSRMSCTLVGFTTGAAVLLILEDLHRASREWLFRHGIDTFGETGEHRN